MRLPTAGQVVTFVERVVDDGLAAASGPDNGGIIAALEVRQGDSGLGGSGWGW